MITSLGLMRPAWMCSISRGRWRLTLGLVHALGQTLVDGVAYRQGIEWCAVHPDDGHHPTLVHRVDRPVQRRRRAVLQLHLDAGQRMRKIAGRLTASAVNADVGPMPSVVFLICIARSSTSLKLTVSHWTNFLANSSRYST